MAMLYNRKKSVLKNSTPESTDVDFSEGTQEKKNFKKAYIVNFLSPKLPFWLF